MAGWRLTMRPSLNRLGYPALVGLLALAAFGLRFYALTEVPPTLWVDEAWFEFRAREILAGGYPWPTVDRVFASGNSPFQIYASVLVQALGAPAAYASRWVSAAAGTLAVLAAGWLASVMFAGEAEAARRLATLTSLALLAPLFAAVLFSRDGTQNSGCVLMTALFLGGLHRAFETRRPGWSLLAGAALAVGLTTYEAALALPLVLGVYAAARAATGSGPRAALATAGLIGLSALVLSAPLLVYYAQHPEVVLNRLAFTQNVVDRSALAALGRALTGYGRVWGGVAFQGDQLFGQNLSGRPLLDPFAAALLGVGLVAAARGWRRPAAQLLLIAAALQALPSAVTANAPAFTRMLPMLPALAALAGRGAAALWGWAAARGPRWRWAAALVLAGGLGLGGLRSVYDYFVVWANDPRLFDARQIGVRLVVERARALAAAGPVWLTPRSHPFAQYAFAIAFDDVRVQTWDAGLDCRPYADRRPEPTTYGVIQVMDPLSLAAFKQAYPGGSEPAVVMHPEGYAFAVFWQAPAGAPAPQPQQPVSIQFRDGPRLVGYDAPAAARPGEAVTIRLHWSAEGPQTAGLTGFVHIGRGRASRPLIAQHDSPLCPGLDPGDWGPGFHYLEARTVQIAPEAPPGDYDIRVGVYNPALDARLPAFTADQVVEDDRVILSPFTVLSP